MSKNQKNHHRKTEQEFKQDLKNIWKALLWVIPVLIAVTYLFGVVLKLQTWLVIFINVVLGGFICLLVYIIFDKIQDKKRLKDFLESDEKDVFKD